MKRFLSILFGLWSSISVADMRSTIAALEANANQQANAFQQEINALNPNNLPSAATHLMSEPLTPQIIPHPQDSITNHLNKVSSVLVFLSFSMPEKSLQGWLKQCQQSGATPIIRGLVGHSLKETLMRIEKLAQQTGTGVQLDSILFKTFAISTVPAVVYVKTIPDCAANQDCQAMDYDKIFGDVTLDYALEKMVNDKEEQAYQPLNVMIKRLRGQA